jgi:hypothetical protein
MKRGRIIYEGNFLDWILANILVFLLCMILAIPTLGLSLVYFGYYQVIYFLERLSIEIEN